MADAASVELLKIRPDLPAKLRQWIDEALAKCSLSVPEVQVDYAGQETAASLRTTSVVVRRGDPSKKPAGSPGEPLVIWVNSKEIDSEHVRLEYTDGEWLLYGIGAGVTGISKAEARPVEVPAGGKPWKTSEAEFAFRIRSFKFNVKATDTQPAKVTSLERNTKPPAPYEKPQATPFQTFGCDFTLISPKGFWQGRERFKNEILRELWEKVADDFKIAPCPPLDFSVAPPGVLPSPQEQFSIKLNVSGDAQAFSIDIADSFCRSLLEKARNASHPLQWDQLLVAARKPALVTIGEQDLSLDQLMRVGPTMVVVLKSNSSSFGDLQTGRRWKLAQPKGPLFAPGPKPFRIGEEIRENLRNGGFMPELPDLGQVKVRVQVVLSSVDMPLGDLQKYAPGHEVLLDLKENAEVAIAINGQLLGTGKLVRIGDERLGVRVLHWNV
jgi:hypothetical protein